MTTSSNNAGPTVQAMYDATRKRRKDSRRSRHGGDDISYLNITPMMDMMTILLVFLIKSFASSAQDISVSNLTLPHSSTKIKIEEALQLMVTSKEVLLDQKVVTRLDEKGNIDPGDLPDGPQGYLIQPLYDALEKRSQYFKDIEKFGGTKFNGRIAIVADRGIPYKTLFKILYTSGRAEFGLFKLFVQKPPE